MVILPTQLHLEQLFVEVVQIATERMMDDSGAPVTPPDIIAQSESARDDYFCMDLFRAVITAEGLSDGEEQLDRQAQTLIDWFRQADLIDMASSPARTLSRGRVLIRDRF